MKPVQRLSVFAAGFALLLICDARVHADVLNRPCIGSWMEKETEIEMMIPVSQVSEHELGDDLTLRLEPSESGWQVQILKTGDRRIPTRGRPGGIPPQPRPDGQVLREYVFGPGMDAFEHDIVPGGQSNMPVTAPTVEPELAASGRIHLDIGPAEYGQKDAAHQNVRACVTWNIFPREPDDAHYGGTGAPEAVPKWQVVAFEDCGLSKDQWITDQMFRRSPFQSAILEPDLDGDGARDLLAITRSDQGRTLYACLRRNRRLVTVAPDASVRASLEAGFLDEAGYWAVNTGQVQQLADEKTQSVNAPDPDTVTIGTEGTSVQVIRLSPEGELRSDWQND